MNRITATTLALAMMIGGAGGALAQGTTAPATDNNAPAATAPATPAAPAAQMPAKKAPAKKMVRRTTHRTMRRGASRTTPLDNRATQALNLLAANGYTGVSDFKVDGKQFTATATQNGKSVPVTIDVDAKTVKAGS